METKQSPTDLALIIIGGTFLPAGIAVGILINPTVGIGMAGLGLVLLIIGLVSRNRYKQDSQ